MKEKTLKILKDVATGNVLNAEIKIISLGLGVQSTALYLMSSMGIIERADHAIFSDPGSEHKVTYELERWLVKWQKDNDGIPLHIVRSSLHDDLKGRIKDPGKRVASLPLFAKGGAGKIMRQCTSEYKIQPVMKKVRELLGLKPRKRMKPTEVWLGITIDEAQRMKDSGQYNISYRYPLIQERMNRADCMNFLRENNFPVPAKSACVFCPFHSDKFWRSLKKENGDEWKTAIEVDKLVRHHPKMREKMYIHRSCVPLDEIDFVDQQDLFEDECEGYCGI